MLRKDLKLSEWISYPNSLMELCLCLVFFVKQAYLANLTNFGQVFASFTPAIGSMKTSWNHGFLCETQKYGEKLNITWMITSYIGILAIFCNFWANTCLVHSTRSLSGCIFAWNHCGQIFFFRITQKIVPVWKCDENFC